MSPTLFPLELTNVNASLVDGYPCLGRLAVKMLVTINSLDKLEDRSPFHFGRLSFWSQPTRFVEQGPDMSLHNINVRMALVERPWYLSLNPISMLQDPEGI